MSQVVAHLGTAPHGEWGGCVCRTSHHRRERAGGAEVGAGVGDARLVVCQGRCDSRKSWRSRVQGSGLGFRFRSRVQGSGFRVQVQVQVQVHLAPRSVTANNTPPGANYRPPLCEDLLQPQLPLPPQYNSYPLTP